MRHLVSVVTDQHVSYFVSDGDEVEQMAQVANRGLDVRGVIRLGDVLVEALGLNGHKVAARRQPALVADAPPRLPPAPSRKGQAPYPYTINKIIEFVDAHPEGVSYADLWEALLPTFDKRKAIAAMAFKIKAHLRACEDEGVLAEFRIERRRTGDNRPPLVFLVPVR